MRLPAGRAKPLRRWLANLALALAGVVFAFALAEIVLRITGLGETSFYVFDRYLGWKPRAGAQGWQREEGEAFIKINRLGYRGPEVSLAKPPGTFRIVVLGDSFAEAKQVPYEKTFPALMQREIAGCPELGPAGFNKVEVLNLGCDGYGTAQELIALRREALRYSPDLVVLAVFTGNDIRNNSAVIEGDKCRPFYIERGARIVLGGPFEDSWTSFLDCFARFESRHVQVLNVMGKARSAIRAYLRKPPAKAHPEPTGHEPGVSDRIYLPPADPVWESAWRVTEWEIQAVAEEAAKHGARTLVVTLSNPIQDHRNRAARDKYQQWLGAGDLFYPDQRIKALGDRDRFPVLNLAPPFQEYAETHNLCLHGFPNTAPCSGHWNELGHKLAADLISIKIRDLLKPLNSK